MERFARVADAVSATPQKLAKVALVAAYLRSLDDADLVAAARFFTGNPFAARDQRSLKVGGRTISLVAERVRLQHDLTLFAPELLTPSTLSARFEEIAGASGPRAAKTREAILERILRACRDRLEMTYVIKIITGDLRIGLKEGLIHDAVADAFDRSFQEVHRAAMACGDVGEAALAARMGTLDRLHVAYGAPIGFMLATPVPYGGTYAELRDGRWYSEAKFDGIRIQAHVYDGRVTLFSRNLNDVTASYPEVADALRSYPARAVLDGEIVALRDGRVQPFRVLQGRLQRKEVDAAHLASIPLAYVVFDAIALDDAFLIDEPFERRRTLLAEALVESPHVRLSPIALVDDAGAAAIESRFASAREDGHEGLMLKRADSPYAPGKRGKYWLKLKRELATIDVVVVAVEWGHGKRSKVLSDYTFAVQNGEGRLLTIGKAYTGLTDKEIAEMTQWFLAHQTGTKGGTLLVEPEVVLEVAFDIVQRSSLHQSGYSLRFPRIVRIRDDKPPAEIDTLSNVDAIYEAMLRRETASER